MTAATLQEPDDYRVDCCNEDCGWSGLKSQCVHPKHAPEMVLCPKCNEVTEPVHE